VQPVLLGIDRQPRVLAGGPVDRIVALSRDHQSILARDGGTIVRIDLITGSRQALGAGTAPSWSA
jgi:hypothetical protein